MILILVIALIFSCQVLGSHNIGGQINEIHDYLWLVSIQKNNSHICAGSIISKKVILTEAHCVCDSSPNSLKVQVGSSRIYSGGKLHKVIAMKVHEDFGKLMDGHTLFLNDVALLGVPSLLKFGSNVAIVQLAKKGTVLIPGTDATVVGWELGSATKELKSTELHIIDNAACARAYGDKKGTRMSNNHLICADEEGRGSCTGDYGGPIISGPTVLVGIASTGIICSCQRYPGIYTDVAYHRDWISNNSRSLESFEYLGGTLVHRDPITNQTLTIPSIV